MNRIIFSLVSYFVCSLFFVGLSNATTFTVTSSANSGAGTLRDIITTQLPAAGAGPHTVVFAAGITSITGLDYPAITLSTSNVTIDGGSTGCDPKVTITGFNDYYAFGVNASNVTIKGIKWGIRLAINGGSNNRVFGCWFNLDDTGTFASGHTGGSTLYIGNSTNAVIGSSADCKLRNVFSAGGTSSGAIGQGIMVAGACDGLVIAGNYIGSDKTGTVAIANNSQNGIFFSLIDDQNQPITTVVNNARIDSNTVIGCKTNGIYITGTTNNLLIRRNYIGAKSDGTNGGATDLGNKKAGLRFEANTNSLTVSNNISIDNGQGEDLADNSGLYIFGSSSSIVMSNVTLSNNIVGVDINYAKKGNDFAGIYIQGTAGANDLTNITVSGNTVGDNGNGYPNKKSHGIAFRDLGPAGQTNVVVSGNYVGTTSTNLNVGNYGNGMELYNISGFTVNGNIVGFNKFATTVAGGWSGGGIMINGGSTNGAIKGNYVGVALDKTTNIGNINPTNAVYPNQMAGITLEQSTNVTIGGTTPADVNYIENNDWGIQLTNVGATLSSSNTIIGNFIKNQVSYGIYIPGGSNNTIGNGTAAGANIITANTSDGINILNTTSVNNKISQNQIYCNTGQGIKLNYGASQGNSGLAPPVITAKSGTTVSGTAPSGATIEIFADDPSCPIACGASTGANRREGKIYRATVTATGGVWTYTNATVATDSISATATSGSNTSEFSYCNILSICPTANAGSNQTLACGVTSTTLAATAPGSGESGKWTVVPANPAITFTDATLYNTTVSGLPNGVTTLRWTLSKTGCPDDFKDITITVSTAVTANAGSNFGVCNVTTATLSANNPSPGTGAWTTTSGTGVATTPSSNTSGVTGLTVGAATVFKWTVTNGACSANASVTVTSYASVTANAGTAQNVCNSTTATLGATAPSPGTGAWTTTSGTGVATTPSSPTSGVTGLTVGAATTFLWTVTNGTCSATSSVTITSNANVTASAGTNIGVCNATTTSLSANNPSPGTGAWTTTSGTGVATTPSSNTSGVTGLTVGAATVFKWTVTNGACTANSSVTVTSSAGVTANAGTAQNVCNSTTATLAATNPSPGTGAWTTTSGTGVATTPSSNTSGVTGLTVGAATTFLWTVTNGTCSATSSVTITSNANVTASAGTNIGVCNTTTASLSANNPSPGTGAWTTTSGTGVATTPSSNTSGVTGLTVGAATVFKWTVTNGACTANSSVTVTSSAGVTANAGTSQNVCNSTTATLAATNPSPGTGAWTTTSGTGVATTPSSNTSGVTGLTVGAATTFLWTVTNGTCSATSSVTITSDAPVTSNAGTNFGICNATTATLAATNPAVGTGTWTVTSGSGSVTDIHAANSGVTGLTVGTTSTFQWVVTNGSCSSGASTVTITVSSSPQSNAGTSQEVCNATTGTLNANTTISAGTWTGPAGATFGDSHSPNTSVSGLTVGDNIFTWSVTNGYCTTAATSTTTITVDAPSASNAGSDQSFCNVTTASLNAGTSVGNGTWSGPSGVTIADIHSATSGVSGLAVGSNVFTWSVQNGVCTAATSTMTITVSAPGTTSAGADQGLCNVTTTTLAGSGAGTWTPVSGTGIITTPTDPNSGVTGLTVGGTSVFKWTVTSGACSGSAQVSVTVSAPATGAAGTDQGLCNATTTTLSATGTGTWTTASGTGVVTDPTNAASGVTGLTVGATSVFTWKVVNGFCTSTTNLSVVSSSPATSNAGSGSTLCNATTANLAATGTGTWTTTAGTGIVTTPSDPNSGVTALTPGQSSDFTWTVTSGNCSATSTVTIVSSAPVTANAGSNIGVCGGTTATLASTTPTVGTGTWTVTSGTGLLTTPTDPHSGVTNLTADASSVFLWTVTNGACSDTAHVTVHVTSGVTADAGSDQLLCNSTASTLAATAGTNGHWLSSTDATIDDLNSATSTVTVINSPATLTWVIDAGACGTASATVMLTSVSLAKPTVSGSGTSGVCSGSTYTFNVTNVDAGATYGWTKSAPGSDVNLHLPVNTTSVDVDATSSDYIVVTVDKGGCEDTARVAVKVLPGLPSSGGTFHLATCADSLLVKTIVFDTNFYTGSWSSTDGGITFHSQTDSTFFLGHFTNGKDTLTYTVNGSCGTSVYTFYLQVGGEFLSAVMSGPSDTLCVGHNRELTMEVTPADTNNSYTYVWVSHVNFDHPVIDNTVHLDTTSVGVYNVSPDSDKNIYLGYVYDKYSGCQAAIDTARVYASTGQDLNVPNLITPNGDHQNDHWLLKDKVTHQDILPGSKFDLYNRWGQRVFTMDSYDNRFDANGISDGIYFFNLKAGCGGKEYKGWLQILGNTNP